MMLNVDVLDDIYIMMKCTSSNCIKTRSDMFHVSDERIAHLKRIGWGQGWAPRPAPPRKKTSLAPPRPAPRKLAKPAGRGGAKFI